MAYTLMGVEGQGLTGFLGLMSMQNHMWAKIRDSNSISHAWILTPCLAPFRRKMFMSYVWIFTLLLLHTKISVQMFMLLSIIQLLHALSFVCRMIYIRQRVMLDKITPALHKY